MQTKFAVQSVNHGHRFQAMAEPVTAAGTLTAIATYDVRALEFLCIGITIATAALTQWQTRARTTPGGTQWDVSAISDILIGEPTVRTRPSEGCSMEVMYPLASACGSRATAA